MPDIDIVAAWICNGYMSNEDIAARMVESGMTPEDAYLTFTAARILAGDRMKEDSE